MGLYQNNRFLAIIPARGGSKGIANKNIIDVNGKPLIQYSIDSAKASTYIDKIVVSTDSTEIAEAAKICGADIPALRPEYLASDTAKTIDALLHMVEEVRKAGDEYHYLVLLQPTQPLRQGFHIDEAIEWMVNRKAKSLVSISKVNEHPVLMRTQNNDGTLNNLLKVNSSMRRQEFPDFYRVNGAIYINRLDDTFTKDISLNDNEIGYEMDRKYDVDIDEPIDLEIAKLKLKHLSLLKFCK
jgi:CMP-N,N'-diacetyllegionaminic acid synthase